MCHFDTSLRAIALGKTYKKYYLELKKMEVDPIQLFHRATEHGDTSVVKKSLDDGLDVDAQDHDNNTALHIAAANAHEHVLTILLSWGANIECTNNMGWTPLMQAARHGHLEVLQILLKSGSAIDKQNKLGMTALHLASVSGHMGTIRALIDGGADYNVIPSITTGQVNPLMIAAQHGNDAVVRLYLDKGVSPNKCIPKTGITTLMFSAAGGNLSTAQILLARYVDPNVTSAADLTALDVAGACHRPDIANFLQPKTTQQKKKGGGALAKLMSAAREGDVNKVQEMLFNEPQLAQGCNNDGATPLMLAAMCGHKQVCQILLQYGAHIDAQDHKNGWTALMQAIYHRQTLVAKFLIQCGADINIQTLQGYTAFYFAHEMLDTDIIKILVEAQMPSLLSSSSHQAWPGRLGGSPAAAASASVGIPGTPTTETEEGGSKLKHWWNRVSKNRRFNKVKGVRPNRPPSPDNSIRELPTDQSFLGPLASPILYDPILPQETPLTPIMDFGGGSSHVLATMKSMVPPHISTAGGPTGLRWVMPSGRKIIPGTGISSPRHATNARLLKSSLAMYVSTSLGSSFASHSLQSSGESKAISAILKPHRKNYRKIESNQEKSQMQDADDTSTKYGFSNKASSTLNSEGVSSSYDHSITEYGNHELRNKREDIHMGPSLIESGSSVGSTINTVTSSSCTRASGSSRSTATLCAGTHNITDQSIDSPSLSHLTISIGSGQLQQVLQKLQLTQYLDLFDEQEVDLDAFLELSESDLQDLGIDTTPAINKILAAITSLKAKI